MKITMTCVEVKLEQSATGRKKAATLIRRGKASVPLRGSGISEAKIVFGDDDDTTFTAGEDYEVEVRPAPNQLHEG